MSVWGGSPYVADPNAVARGKVPGCIGVHKFGENPIVGANFETIWEPGGAYNFLTQAQAAPLRVRAGGNAADDAAGSGARTIRIYGLGTDGLPIEEDISLAGASASAATTASFLRINRGYVLTCGTALGGNVGEVIIETTGGIQVGDFTAEEGQTEQAVYSIPAGRSARFVELYLSTDGNGVNARLCRRSNITAASAPFGPVRIAERWYGVTSIAEQYQTGFVIEGPADVWVEAQRSSGANSAVSASFEMWEYDS